MKELEREEEVLDRILVEKKEAQEDDFQGLYELFAGLEYGKQSQFEKKMQVVKKVYRVTSGSRDPIMSGRILGCSTNKYIHFIADTGSPVALIPRSVVTRNKLEIFPTDPDEASYAGASGTRLTVLGQCQMFVNFRQQKKWKSTLT